MRTESLRILIDCPLSRGLVFPFPDRLPNPRILQKLAVPIIATPKCNLLYSKDVESDFQLKTIKDDMLCAGFAEGKKDACKVGCTAKVWLLTTLGVERFPHRGSHMRYLTYQMFKTHRWQN